MFRAQYQARQPFSFVPHPVVEYKAGNLPDADDGNRNREDGARMANETFSNVFGLGIAHGRGDTRMGNDRFGDEAGGMVKWVVHDRADGGDEEDFGAMGGGEGKVDQVVDAGDVGM